MKKLTAIILAMLLACGTLMGCDKDEPHEASKGNETTQSETSAQTEEVSKDYDQDDSQQGFTIYGKKYYYKGNSFMDPYNGLAPGNMLLLTVTNETETDYKATVKITYLDENGEKIKTQSKSFLQYIAGYQNYFLFQPGEEYASYTCELTLTELTDEEKADIIVDKIKITCNGLRERITADAEKIFSEGVIVEVPTIMMETFFTFTEEVSPKIVGAYLVLIDETGEICYIDECGGLSHPQGSFVSERETDHYIYFDRENRAKAEWPEELKGELTVLMFPTSIEDVKAHD